MTLPQDADLTGRWPSWASVSFAIWPQSSSTQFNDLAGRSRLRTASEGRGLFSDTPRDPPWKDWTGVPFRLHRLLIWRILELR